MTPLDRFPLVWIPSSHLESQLIPGMEARDHSMKLLVIRGDLQAHSGYSAAIRAYCKILQSLFDRVIGVDIHFSKERAFESFPHPLVSEAEARHQAAKADATLALSITTPNHYVRLPNATNIGLTFWETE